jgi:hypothetical protein
MPGGRIIHRARGIYQIQRTGHVSAVEWVEMVGLSEHSFFVSGYTAARLLSAHERRCKSIAGAISGYATGGRCGWGGTPNRVAMYQRLLVRVSAPFAPPSERQLPAFGAVASACAEP